MEPLAAATALSPWEPGLLSLGLYTLMVLGLLGLLLFLSGWLGEQRPRREKLRPYECGVIPTGAARFRYPVPFYLVAIFFLSLDVEGAYIFSWAISAEPLGWPGWLQMSFFILVLLLGLLYLWKKGGLDWRHPSPGGHPGRGPDDQLRNLPGPVPGAGGDAGRVLQPGGDRRGPGPLPLHPVLQPLGFLIFLVSAGGEIKRIPFDLPEAENELMAGYHTEYSGMRFGLYFLGEYVTMVVLGSLVAVFFLGGWRGPWLPPLAWFLLKVAAVVFFMIWLRATFPRLRYDQLMHLGWKFLIPLALLNIVVTGGVMLGLRA